MQVITAVVVGFAMVCFSIGMAHVLCRCGRRRWLAAVIWIVCALAVMAVGILFRLKTGRFPGHFTCFLVVFTYLFLFDVPLWQRIFTCFFVHTAMYLTVALSSYTVMVIHMFFQGFNPYTVFMPCYFFLMAVCAALFLRYLRAPMAERLTQFGAYLRPLTLFAGMGYLLMVRMFGAWRMGKAAGPGEFLNLMLYACLLACGYYLAFFTMTAVKETALTQARVQELTAQVRQSEQYYLTLADHIQDVRRMQHDSRHHLRVLNGYVQDGAYGRLKEYLSELTEQAPDTGRLFYCTNYTANILLVFYTDQAKSADIEFGCDAQIPAGLPCTPMDICTILGNALQNATEACSHQAPGEKRYISLLARVVGENLTLEIKNSYDGVVEEQDGRFLSRKEEPGHGLGLVSIRHVAEKYRGYCMVRWTEREFTLSIVLPLNEPTPS